MPQTLRAIAFSLLVVLAAQRGHSEVARAAAAGKLVIATWNMEWLVTPEAAHAARLACRSGQRAKLPCDVARSNSRDSADLARLAWYARHLDADIIAFQEVENASIAQRIFGGYRICITSGYGSQQVGFAIRPGIAHRCGPQLDTLSLGGSQRSGMTLILYPNSSRTVELLAVHLKSGCADAALEPGPKSCALLAAQARQLSRWISARADSRFILLGDFNRGDADLSTDEFWLELQGGDFTYAPFVFANAGVPFRNCHMGAGFTRAIDHILVSRALSSALIAGSFRKLGYPEADALRYRLSDHCPVVVSLIP
jgi:endonuclease/exonuclease/phosphatase family metal-dependent hydrolase